MNSKTTKRLSFLSLLGCLLIYSCGPAGVTSGTYNGTFTGDSLPNNSGNGTITITANGQLVDVQFESPGNPTIIQTGVTVVDQTSFGGTGYAFNFDDGLDYLGGTYQPDATKYLHISCIHGQYFYEFAGFKQ